MSAGVAALIYAHTYQPIGDAGFGQGGPDDIRVVKQVTDGLHSDTYVVLGPAGTVGTVNYTMANNGPFDIRLLGPPRGDIVRYRWAPPSFTQNGSLRAPTLADSQPLPMTLRSHQVIQLFVSATKPSCLPGGSTIIDQLGMRWEAFGVHHLTFIALDAQGIKNPIAVCFPRSALRHLVGR